MHGILRPVLQHQISSSCNEMTYKIPYWKEFRYVLEGQLELKYDKQ